MKSKKVFLQEEELIIALKNQEIIGMQALLDMYSYSLGGIIFRILKDKQLSEDVLQEVILKIWDSAAGYEVSKGRLFTWLLNITKNYAITILRSKRYKNSKKNINIDTCYQLIEENHKVCYNSDTIGIKELVYSLKPEFNIVLEMVYFRGYTHLETAAALNMPLGTVKTRIRKAMVELRDLFKQQSLI